ncbi:hypothetical protein [Gordonia sp. NPDC003585]|uniref:hypothetical protein n=1 Tax=Gordonia sp. NPDC003585 TaxID=3154275 RepID=UPI00339ECF20
MSGNGRASEPLIAGASGALALCTFFDIPPTLRLLLLLPLILAGFGAAVCVPVRPATHLKLALYLALGLAAPIALGTVLVWVGWYSAAAVTITLATVCLASSAVALRTEQRRTEAIELVQRSVLGCVPAMAALWSRRMAALGVAAVLWVTGLMTLWRTEFGLFGLMFTVGGVLLAACLVTLICVFVACLVADDTPGAVITILGTIVAIRVTATLLTDVPIYSWTYKHIGLVDYISKESTLPPSFIDIYSSWPGFFVGGAWFSDTTGIAPTDVAHWFAPATHVLLALSIWGLGRALGGSSKAALIAVMCAELVNWVGQDYYSPQAIAMIIAITVLALLVGSKTDTGTAYYALPLFAVVVVTHQLTPVWLLICVVLLTLLNHVRPIWFVGAFIAIFGAFIVPRIPWIVHYGGFTGANPLKNSKTNLPNLPGDSLARTVLQDVDRAVFLTVWAAAAIAFIYLWRHGRRDLALPVIAFSPGLLLGGQSYGGEAIFRVLLYSLVGCSVLVGIAADKALFGPASGPERTRGFTLRRKAVVMAVAMTIVGVSALHSYYGGWSYIQLTRGQVTMSQEILAEAEPSTVIVQIGPSGWPPRATADYVRLAEANPGYDKALIFLKESMARGFPTPEDMRFLVRLGAGTGGKFYLVLPRQMSAYSDYFGYFRKGAIEILVSLLDENPNFVRFHTDADTIIFMYHHTPTDREPW